MKKRRALDHSKNVQPNLIYSFSPSAVPRDDYVVINGAELAELKSPYYLHNRGPMFIQPFAETWNDLVGEILWISDL